MRRCEDGSGGALDLDDRARANGILGLDRYDGRVGSVDRTPEDRFTDRRRWVDARAVRWRRCGVAGRDGGALRASTMARCGWYDDTQRIAVRVGQEGPRATTGRTSLQNPTTATGPELTLVVLLPSWPWSSAPQQVIPPADAWAQEWFAPADTNAKPDDKPVTAAGTRVQSPEPLPTRSPAPSPQHMIPPEEVSAQVWYKPADRARTPLESPTTSTGTELLR